MPISKRNSGTGTTTPATADTTPAGLRPYTFHGVDLSLKGGHGVGECPFCKRDGKFSVDIDTGLWRCFACGGGQSSGGGNALTFIRALHGAGIGSATLAFHAAIAADRRLLRAATPRAWGICPSPINPAQWLLPGFAIDGRLDQLYRRVQIKDSDGTWSWRLLPTPGVWPEGKVHALHLPADDYDPECETIYICEGPWDGMALWEITSESPQGQWQVLAVPGCNIWRDDWTRLCKGKTVVLLYDSDHPRVQGSQTYRAGYDGMGRIAKKISGIAKEIHYLEWGPEGYDPNHPSGRDVRDVLSGAPGEPLTTTERLIQLEELQGMIRPIPVEWSVALPTYTTNGKHHIDAIESQSCHQWNTCEDAWREAMRWRTSMSDALAVLFAVCASTQQAGNQLFLDLVGSAGSGKTTLCEGLLVSNHCHHLEHLTGFHSGFKPGKEDPAAGKDCSLIARVNGKTLITPEFDVMRSSPKYAELMAQTRRIFDGKSGATYKNSDEDTLYVGLRTPWIRAGTPAIMDGDQSQLGDRFLRIIIDDPNEEEKRLIMRSAIRSERIAMLDQSNGTAGSVVDPKTRRAYALTGGYVDWLRANVEDRIGPVLASISDEVEDRCVDLAELCADLRARPNEDKRKKESHDCKELPTRLARQNIRLAAHLAVVFNRPSVDSDIMRIVRKVALDTAHGHSLNVVRWLCARNPKVPNKTYQECGGIAAKTFEMWLSMTEERTINYLLFLRKIGVLDMRRKTGATETWVLSQRVLDLYTRVMEDDLCP